MKRVLINGGDGKMGKAIARVIKHRPELELDVLQRESGQPTPETFDIIIDFSSPEGAQEAFYLARQKKKPFLTGTTNLPETFLFQMQEEDKIPVFYAPNVSLSVYFFGELLKMAAQMYRGYHAQLHEIHHVHKKDAPSGTAKKLADMLGIQYEDVTYERTGETVGTHSLMLRGEYDEVTLTHRAIDRDLFADSAVRIAAWLLKQPCGFYTMSDYAKFALKGKVK